MTDSVVPPIERWEGFFVGDLPKEFTMAQVTRSFSLRYVKRDSWDEYTFEQFNSRRDAEDKADALEGEGYLTRIFNHSYLTCDCGETVGLGSFTNTCSCGADYNMSGQRLAPRSQWGEETGEHWIDCY